MKTKLNCVCSICKTDNILMRSGVMWNVREQRLEALSNCVDAFCTQCNDDVDVEFIRLLDDSFSCLLDEIDISIACLLDNAMDEETQADVEHIQEQFTIAVNKLRDADYNVYEK